MKARFRLCLTLLGLFVFLAACVPYTFTSPSQLHIHAGDHINQAVISLDAHGRSHIAGVENDRIVYYRTNFGSPLETHRLAMDASGDGWKQYNPDIASTNNGSAWIVWTEQRGGADKFACYQHVPRYPPLGGYDKRCLRLELDTLAFTTGNVMVVGRGSRAFALYDTRNGSGRIGQILYKELTDMSNSGVVYSFSDNLESGYLYSWDAEIDLDGYLHVGLIYDDGYDMEYVTYRSNRTTLVDGTMTQGWKVNEAATVGLEEQIPVRLATYMDGIEEIIAVVHSLEFGDVDWMLLHTCPTDWCAAHTSSLIDLPPVWETHSVLDDVEIVGTGENLQVGFIGDNGTTVGKQVYYKSDAFSTDGLEMISDNRPTFKFDLEAVAVEGRPESLISGPISSFSWGESNLTSIQYFTADAFVSTKVYDTSCLTSMVGGEVASNGIHFAGVWDACLDTWFSAQAYQGLVPLMLR